MIEIVPTILTNDLNDFFSKLQRLDGVCNRVQIDIVDGKFFNNKTVSLEDLKDLREHSNLKIDLHLMVEEPESWISRSLELLPDRIIGHVEKMSDPNNFISEVIESGVGVGLALDIDTPTNIISDDLYLLTDIVLILGVKAGTGGQEFNPQAIEKIKKIRDILKELGNVGIDGGINEKNIALCAKAGANIFCIGNSFWNSEDLQKRYNELLTLVNDGR